MRACACILRAACRRLAGFAAAIPSILSALVLSAAVWPSSPALAQSTTTCTAGVSPQVVVAGGSSTLSWSSTSDGDGILEVIHPGGATGVITPSGSYTYTSIPAGTYTWQFVARDVTGQSTRCSTTLMVVSGSSGNAQSCSASVSLAYLPTGASATLKWASAGDLDGALDVVLPDGSTNRVGANGSYTYTGVPPGSYTWKFTARNAAGQPIECTTTLLVTGVAPPAPPSCTAAVSPTVISSGGASTLSWSSTSDADGLLDVILPDGSAARVGAAGSYTYTNVPSGTYTWRFTARNASGQAADCATTLVVSGPASTPPSCTANMSPPTIAAGGSSTLTWSSTGDANGLLEVTLSGGGGGQVGPSGSYLYTNVPSGAYTWTFSAINGAGQLATCSATLYVTGGGPGTGGEGDYSTSFVTNETGDVLVTLTGSKPSSLDVNDYITLNETSELWAFTAAEFSADFWALDATNAQRFLNGQGFQGYRLNPQGQTGMNFVTVPAGRYYIGVVAGQTVYPSYSNRTFHEVSTVRLPNWRQNGNLPMAADRNPGGWQARTFTWPTGDVRAFIETEGTGGKFAVMTAAQYQSFAAAYANGYNGGSYSYIYACGGQSGAAATEIECELKLIPGSYALVFINDTAQWQGGAANIGFYAP